VEELSIIYSITIFGHVLQPEQPRTIASQKYSFFDIIFMKSSIQTKSAVTLTFASVLLLSGLWALWHTPTTTYEPRKNEQITGLDVVTKPDGSSTHAFKVKENVEELTVNAWPQIITIAPSDPAQPPPEITPVISIAIQDPQGTIIKSYDNITSVSEAEKISVASPGDFKVSLTNHNADNDVRTELRINDVTKVPNYPNGALGQWLVIVSTPIFGLAAWFTARSRRKLADGS
jgi:hypothetical protein